MIRLLNPLTQNVSSIMDRLPYLGNKGEEFVKTWIPNLKRCFKTNEKSNVIYTIKCPACGEDCVRKFDRCVITRLNEHSNRSYQPMFQHLQHYEKFLITMTYQLPDIYTDLSTVN